jgi:acyl-coenzyme A synthetase/AMP-(fatty) acid ligase
MLGSAGAAVKPERPGDRAAAATWPLPLRLAVPPADPRCCAMTWGPEDRGAGVVAVINQGSAAAATPMLAALDPPRPVAFRAGAPVDAARFLADVQALASTLPDARHALNLCEDRYRFLVGFCAVMLRGQTSLLPPSRAPEVVADALARHPDSYCLVDPGTLPEPPRAHPVTLPDTAAVGSDWLPRIDDGHCVAIGFTSGSTGAPQPNRKSWGSFRASTARNAALLGALCEAALPGACGSIVATVPPQHMYGMELSVLLPLCGRFAVHAGRPFFPAEVAAALAAVPAPRILVSTPVHLRALLQSGLALPPLAGIVSATAPLPQALAQALEAAWRAPVQELFGSTETCVIAHRRAASEAHWTLYDDVTLQPQPDGTLVQAPWFAAPVLLQDLVELLPGRQFRLCGRNADLLEIAGKRASLGELTQRVLALPGVEDAVVFQSERADAGGVRRIAALVVAPGRDPQSLLAELRPALDPVFLPRPLKCVERLPRNATGKLPREALLALLGEDGAGG